MCKINVSVSEQLFWQFHFIIFRCRFHGVMIYKVESCKNDWTISPRQKLILKSDLWDVSFDSQNQLWALQREQKYLCGFSSFEKDNFSPIELEIGAKAEEIQEFFEGKSYENVYCLMPIKLCNTVIK